MPVVLIGILATGLIALLHLNPIERLLSREAFFWIYDSATILAALLCASLALALFLSYERGEVFRVIWGSLAVGLLLWAFGEAIWAAYQLVLKVEVPYPSIADVLWVAGYLPVIFGLATRYRTYRIPLRHAWQMFVLGLFALGVVLAARFIIWPIAAYEEYTPPVERALNLLYPLGDLSVALLALLITLVLTGGALSVPWGYIAAGYLIMATSDLLFTYASWNGIYPEGGADVNVIMVVIDVMYLAAYIIIAIGLYSRLRLQSRLG